MTSGLMRQRQAAFWGVLLVFLLGMTYWPHLSAQEAGSADTPAEAPVRIPEPADPAEPAISLDPDEAADTSDREIEPDAPTSESAADSADKPDVVKPLVIVAIGISIVLGLIIVLKINAFIALITAAIVVSILAPGSVADKISRVASAFGSTAGSIGIVIAMAAVIGKCMLDSGAADRIVRFFLGWMGEKRAPVALMGSGYVLAIPVFFDTVFYLLVPLARSLHRRTGVQYLKYILAIGAGGALTHSLVPPTPGPLLMASTLGIDLGAMILVGALVALPAAFGGVIFAGIADRLMKTPMRSIGNQPEPEPLKDEELPSLGMALLPVLLPVVLISINTGLNTYADLQHAARFDRADVRDWAKLQAAFGDFDVAEPSPAVAVWNALPQEAQAALQKSSLTDDDEQLVVEGLNQALLRKDLYSENAFLGVPLSDDVKDLLGRDRDRMPAAVLERMNRLLIENSFNLDAEEPLVAEHLWLTPTRRAADFSDLIGNANLALLLSTVIAMLMLVRKRGLSRMELGRVVEESLMSGGVIILITAGGGAFGAMLQKAEIGGAIQTLFGGILADSGGGLAYLFLGFLLASVLKIAQGSGTVAMIVGASMMAAILPPELAYNRVYVATAIGAGSLVGSWMNDSGFWIFAKMGGLTEMEALKSWTLMLVFLGLVSFAVTLLLAVVMPLA